MVVLFAEQYCNAAASCVVVQQSSEAIQSRCLLRVLFLLLSHKTTEKKVAEFSFVLYCFSIHFIFKLLA